MGNPLATRDLNYRSVLLGTMASTYWRDVRYYYPSATIMYICKSIYHKTPTSSDSWYVWKYTLNADGDVERTEGPIIGSVDKRESLGWN